MNAKTPSRIVFLVSADAAEVRGEAAQSLQISFITFLSRAKYSLIFLYKVLDRSTVLR